MKHISPSENESNFKARLTGEENNGTGYKKMLADNSHVKASLHCILHYKKKLGTKS